MTSAYASHISLIINNWITGLYQHLGLPVVQTDSRKYKTQEMEFLPRLDVLGPRLIKYVQHDILEYRIARGLGSSFNVIRSFYTWILTTKPDNLFKHDEFTKDNVHTHGEVKVLSRSDTVITRSENQSSRYVSDKHRNMWAALHHALLNLYGFCMYIKVPPIGLYEAIILSLGTKAGLQTDPTTYVCFSAYSSLSSDEKSNQHTLLLMKQNLLEGMGRAIMHDMSMKFCFELSMRTLSLLWTSIPYSESNRHQTLAAWADFVDRVLYVIENTKTGGKEERHLLIYKDDIRRMTESFRMLETRVLDSFYEKNPIWRLSGAFAFAKYMETDIMTTHLPAMHESILSLCIFFSSEFIADCSRVST